VSAALQIADTVPAEELRHRLALGLELIDALRGISAAGPLRVDLESVGPRPFPAAIGSNPQALRFEQHRADRHALRYAGRFRKLLDKAVADGADTRVVARVYGPPSAAAAGFDPAADARNYVPRRLRFALALDAGQPAATPLNIRTPWLWPGSACALPSTGTYLRGRVLRGATVQSGVPVAWACVFATTPDTQLNFAAATIVGRGHGDDRGEFVIALDRSAVSGAALTNPVKLRLWAFFPPPGPSPTDDPLGLLPIEDAGADKLNDVLRGYTTPAAYTQQVSAPVTVRLGETRSGADTQLLKT
jgi:hypothetical protein